MHDKIADNVIEFSCSTGLNGLKVCHEYLALKHLAKGKPHDNVKATPLAPVLEASISSVRRGLNPVISLSRSVASNSQLSLSKRAPPREPAPLAAAADAGRFEHAFTSAASARMSMSSMSRPVSSRGWPLSMSLENQGGGIWSGLPAPAAPPAGPEAGGSLFDKQGESVFGGGQRNPSNLLEEPPQLVIDGLFFHTCIQF